MAKAKITSRPRRSSPTKVIRRIDLDAIKAALRRRAGDLARFLKSTAPECAREQRHLDGGTAERSYWHYGYLVAVKDILALLQGRKRRLT